MTAQLAVTREWAREGARTFIATAWSIPPSRWSRTTHLEPWTLRHIVAHVAANAQALANLLTWAETGRVTPMYSSIEQRANDIEKGATRPTTELLEWLEQSANDLERHIDRLTNDMWQAAVVTAQGRSVPASVVPWLRAREVYVHAVDLGAAIGFSDLPEPFLAELIEDVVHMRNSSAGGGGILTLGGNSTRDWHLRVDGPSGRALGGLPDMAAYLTGRPHHLTMIDGSQPPMLSRWL